MDWIDLNFFREEFYNLAAFVARERKTKVVLPKNEEILRALSLTSFNDTKVVILGQDPYPTPGHANGLAFSVSDNVEPLPRSLINIFTELKSDLGIERTNGNLTDWAQQGVLLLNSCLTVVAGAPASHAKVGWFLLTTEIIKALSEKKTNVVFILWGRHAQQKGKNIDRSKHLVIESAHPSPLSASRGFFGSKCFSRTNIYLKDNNIKAIEW